MIAQGVCCRCDVTEATIEIIECACGETFCETCLVSHERLCPEAA